MRSIERERERREIKNEGDTSERDRERRGSVKMKRK